MANWTCPRCGGQARVIVTDSDGTTSNRCLTPSCGHVEPVVDDDA